jgi:glucan phosphoethanolaminetransferase (alkaline phosphatase superfamily)
LSSEFAAVVIFFRRMYDVCVCVVVVVFVVDDNIAVILKSRSRFSRFSRFSLSFLSLSLSLSVSVVFFFTNHQQKWTLFFHATHLSLSFLRIRQKLSAQQKQSSRTPTAWVVVHAFADCDALLFALFE